MEAAIEPPGDVRWIDRRDRGRRPGSERRRQGERVLVVGIQERAPVFEPLHPERRGQRREDEVETVRGGKGRTGGKIMIAGIDLVRRLTLQMQRPAIEPRRLRTHAQSVDEPGAPQMLVYVGGHGAPVW